MQNIINKIRSADNIFIIGRGSTARFFDTKLQNSENIVIGYNLEKINGVNLNYLYLSERANVDDYNNKVSTLFSINNIVDSLNDIETVGSVHFELSALEFIDKNLDKNTNLYLYGFDFRSTSEDEDIEKISFSKSMLQRKMILNAGTITILKPH